jgi:hypothetical protein
MRIAMARPVSEVIPGRPLLIKCFVGLAAFSPAIFTPNI